MTLARGTNRLTFAALCACTLAPRAAWASGGEGGLLMPVINFAILIAALVYFVRTPLRNYFLQRRSDVKREIELAAALRKEAEERHARWQRKLVDLDAELEGIRAGSRQRAEAERERILGEARESAERMRSDARLAIEQEMRRARAELRDEAARLAVALAGDLLRAQVGPADDERLIDELIRRIEAGGASAGAGN